MCVGGACEMGGCDAGYTDCSADEDAALDGCETNTGGDAANCGGCGMPCSTANGTPACTAGACSMASCAAGYADCSVGSPEDTVRDGCETATDADEFNCGACGNECLISMPANTDFVSCTAGSCVFACQLEFGDCDGDLTLGAAGNGCESDFNDPGTCGSCTVDCGGCGCDIVGGCIC
jgi:hypothetical protein